MTAFKEPPCDCLWTDVDQTDARGCELHDPDSRYNEMLRQHERQTARIA